MTLPQNKEDEDLMNSVLWNYLMKSFSNDENKVIEAPSSWTFVAANTGSSVFRLTSSKELRTED